jgi:TPR repeat protein
MKMYFTLKKMGPLLIAQQDGSLSNDQLKGFAKEGNTLAMAYLAERLISGKEALSGYMFALQAAESGEPKGQSILAFYLLSGTAAAKNVKRGFDWALKSAEAGDPRGSTLAGVCFIQGIGTVPDKTKGMELLQIGIKGGDPTALQIAKNPGLENKIQFLPLSSGNNSQ